MWHDAYLEQARSDWRTYEAIQSLPLDMCQRLHYLQMATEKLGKAMLLAEGKGIDKVRVSHKAFVHFLQIAIRTCPRWPQPGVSLGRSIWCDSCSGIFPIFHSVTINGTEGAKITETYAFTAGSILCFVCAIKRKTQNPNLKVVTCLTTSFSRSSLSN